MKFVSKPLSTNSVTVICPHCNQLCRTYTYIDNIEFIINDAIGKIWKCDHCHQYFEVEGVEE